MADHVRKGHRSPQRPAPRARGAESVPRPASSSGEVGTRFGRYRLLDRIGSGGMADIFRAFAVGEQGFERVVAIKRIRQEVAQYADIGQLFADEARVSALLEHPNIVQVYDFGSVDGAYYIAMEYLKGHNLEQLLRTMRKTGESLAPSIAVLIAREVANGLAYAHAICDQHGRRMGIVHRDVSPANIMLVHVGAVKLLDFGIARVTSELRQAITKGRKLKGKCPYVAPEQITGGPVDARADIFALGAVMWEMLTGHPLFSGSSDYDTISNVMSQEIAPPSALVPGLPSQLDNIVLTALSRDPNRRYASAQMMAGDLEDMMRLLPSRHGDLTALLERSFGRKQTPHPPVKFRDTAPTPVERPSSETATKVLRVARLSTTSVTPIKDDPTAHPPVTAPTAVQPLESPPPAALRLPQTLFGGHGPLLAAMAVAAVFALVMTSSPPRASRPDAAATSITSETNPFSPNGLGTRTGSPPDGRPIIVRPMLSPPRELTQPIAVEPPVLEVLPVAAPAPVVPPRAPIKPAKEKAVALNVRTAREASPRRVAPKKSANRPKPAKDPSDIHFDPFDQSADLSRRK